MQTINPKRKQPARGFTLVELLVSIAIIAILSVLLFSVFTQVRDKSSEAKCASRLRDVYTVAQLYTADNNGELVPGQISLNPNPDRTPATLWPVLLLPYLGEEDNSNRNKYACPRWREDAVSKTAYNWGFAMNLTPGYEGADTPPPLRRNTRLTVDADGNIKGTRFRTSAITHPSRRLYFCDSYQWHVAGDQVQNARTTFAAYDRHGKNRCNAVFFDGHVESLSPKAVNTAIYDPERLPDPASDGE